MRFFLTCVLRASMASAFQTLILPRGSDGVFAPQASGAGTIGSEQAYTSVSLSDTVRTHASLAMSGGGTAISSGLSPSRNSLNGTYNNPIRLPQSKTSTNVQSLPRAQQPNPTSIGSYNSVTQEAKLTSTTPTPCSTQKPKPTSALSYHTIASMPTPSPVQLGPTVAPERNPSNPKNIVPQVQISLDYAEIGNTDPNKAIRAASVNIAFNLPTVALEHVDSISSVTCPSSDKLVATFTNSDLFHKAVNSWPKSEFNLVNNADGCGDKTNQRSAFQVTSFQVDEKSLTIEATGQMLALNDPNLSEGFTVSFGHHASAQAAPSPVTTQAPHKNHGIRGIDDIGGAIKSEAHSVGGAVTSAVTSVVSTAASEASSATSHVASDVSSATSQVASHVSSVVTDAKTAAADLSSEAVNGFSRGGTWTTGLSAGPQPTQLNQSPFGQAEKLGSSDGMTIWCVKCGANGTIELSGEISAGVDSITAGNLNFQALDFAIPLTFGFEAKDTTLEHTLGPYSLFEIPLTPFEVEPFFSVGPKFTFAVDFKVVVGATGNLKAGVNMHWGNASAAMDLVKNDPNTLHMAGWNPDVEKVFEFSGGEMAINASLGIPISFDIGLSLLQHNIGKNVSITDTPSVELDSTLHVPGNARRGHARDLVVRDNQCPNGVDETIGFQNVVGVNVLGLWKTQLASFSTPLWSTCITTSTLSPSASSSSGSPSPSSVPATTTAPSPQKSNNTAIASGATAAIASAAIFTPTGGTASAGRLPNSSNSTALGSGSRPSGVSSLGPTRGPTGAYTALSGQGAGYLPLATGASASMAISGVAQPTNQVLQVRRQFGGLEHVVRENRMLDVAEKGI